MTRSFLLAPARTVWFPALLLVTGTSSLATDAYLSSLPQVRASLHTTSTITQLTMTTFIAGMALGLLLFGAISDAHGRRTIVLAGCLTFTAMSALSAIATSGWLLVGERSVQGLAAGACVAVGRAVVNDCYQGPKAAATFGTLGAVSLVAPVVAPPIGALLVTISDWRTVFWFLALVGLAMTVAAGFGLPETLPSNRRQGGGLTALRTRARELVHDRSFAAPVIVQCLTTAGFFVYIGGSTFVLQQTYGISGREYTVLFTTNAVAMVFSSVLYRLFVLRLGPVRLRRIAILTQTTAVLLLFVVCLIAPGHRPPLALVWVPLALMTLGLGCYLPASSTIVQLAGRRYAGTASSIGGGLPFLCGALTTPLTGLLGAQNLMTMASVMTLFFAAAAAAAVAFRRTTTVDGFGPVSAPDPRPLVGQST